MPTATHRRLPPPLAWLARRRPAALGLAAAAGTLVALAPLPDGARRTTGAWCLLLAAVIYLTWGTARRDLDARGRLALQTAGVLGFGALALAAVSVGGDLACYLLAAGWLGHAAWDALHHRADRVVPRWYAEACLTADLLVAATLVAAAAW